MHPRELLRGRVREIGEARARRLEGGGRALKIEDALVDALLSDIDEGGAKDALPLLAFTLERLYLECGGDGKLARADYEAALARPPKYANGPGGQEMARRRLRELPKSP